MNIRARKKTAILLGATILFISIIFICLPSSYNPGRKAQVPTVQGVVGRDIYDIISRGELRVVTLEGSQSYFRYRGIERGYLYHRARELADTLGVSLKTITRNSIEELRETLYKGDADVIAWEIPVSQDRDSLIFCGSTFYTPLVLLERGNTKKNLVDSLEDLRGETVHVMHEWMGDYIRSLQAGINVRVANPDSVNEEDLIRLLNQGKIRYVATTEKSADYCLSYYPILDRTLVLGPYNALSWAVSVDSPALASFISRRFPYQKESEQVRMSSNMRLYESSLRRGSSLFISIQDGKVSDYDDLFRKHAKAEGLDWRLIAAIAFTESGFDTTIVSRKGALGIMQVMPETLKNYTGKEVHEANTDDILDAAIKVLKDNQRNLSAIPQEDRMKFVLAAYNSGLGHLRDAQRLAEKYGRNKLKWEGNVEDFIRLKSQEAFYTDSVCKNGFLNGEETVKFVSDVIERWEMIKKNVD